uniref:uncharacterized protein LOC122610213 n=1 Tax=Erigeron canadensis TaxID=72917 RepID=UPI001CB8F068|nr:uncharacterized protein LOC122610213 [Erigeron canadensis]
MAKRFGSTVLLDEPFEWSDDSSLEIFADAIEADGESSMARSRRKVVNRNRWEAGERLFRDYFSDEPKFDDDFFEDRYRMPKRLFLKIVHDLESRYKYFQEGYNGRMIKSFTTIQKCTSAIRQLATGNLSDEYDEYLEMAQRTSRECLEVFCDAIVDTYEQEYLRRPTTHDILRLYEAHEERHHIPGMLGNLDCTHFVWKMCLVELRASIKGQSPFFLPERMGTTPNCPFSVNDHTYRRGYYLVDDIYLKWSTFVKAYKYPTVPKEKKFKRLQESAQKDVERDDGRAISPVHIRDPRVQPTSQHDRLQEIRDEETHFRL